MVIKTIVSVRSIALVFGELTVLARIDVLLQYLSRSVVARFCVWQSRAPALTNACRENYGTRTQREEATRKRSGRGKRENYRVASSVATAAGFNIDCSAWIINRRNFCHRFLNGILEGCGVAGSWFLATTVTSDFRARSLCGVGPAIIGNG